MSDDSERQYMRGYNAACEHVFSQVVHNIVLPRGKDHAEARQSVTQHIAFLEARELAWQAAARDLCGEFGDNDWPDRLAPRDVLEKHCGRRMRVLTQLRDAVRELIRRHQDGDISGADFLQYLEELEADL